MTTTEPGIEIRCPVGPRRLFLKLQQAGQPTPIVEGNLMELACADCRKALLREGRQVSRVLHYYNFVGDWVETKVVPSE